MDKFADAQATGGGKPEEFLHKFRSTSDVVDVYEPFISSGLFEHYLGQENGLLVLTEKGKAAYAALPAPAAIASPVRSDDVEFDLATARTILDGEKVLSPALRSIARAYIYAINCLEAQACAGGEVTAPKVELPKQSYQVRMHPSSTDNHPWGFQEIKAENPELAAKEYANNYTREPEYDDLDWEFNIEVEGHGIFKVACSIDRHYNVTATQAKEPA